MESFFGWLDSLKVGWSDLVVFWAAILAEAVFLLTSCVIRVGRGSEGWVRMNRLHLRMTLVYAVFGGAAVLVRPETTILSAAMDWAIGGVFYFGIHYAIVANFFALARGSVSAAIIAIIDGHGRPMTREALKSTYGGSAGFGHVKESRLGRLEGFLGWVERRDSGYTLSTRGTVAARVTRLCLKAWGLSQLGARRG